MNASILDDDATTGVVRRGLATLLSEVATSIKNPSASQSKLIERVNHLAERLATKRFQLAVLGQFKRGKSTLLNALLRDAVLPTGVVPVTAIPTFIQLAKRSGLRVTYKAGGVEDIDFAETEPLREQLRRFVTEEGNPHNTLDIARVDVFLPSRLLERGVVLIDTPGVGSTHRHNTATADAVLPECDATLFVVSPDPPITQVEIEFLARIRETVAHLTIVMNKVDTLEPHEREAAAAFLRRVLTEQAGLNGNTPIFCISARGALRASERGDAGAFRASGFEEIEAHLTEFLAKKKHATLAAAIRLKAAALVNELQLEIEISLKALHLPMEDLEQRIRTFDEATAQFETERRAASDLLNGDRVRALQELETDAERLRAAGHTTLGCELDAALAGDKDSELARDKVTNAIVAFFDAALQNVNRTFNERIAATFGVHQRRADELIALVRRTAAELMKIPFRAPEASETFETKHDPFWVTSARTVTLSPIPAHALDNILPGTLRRKRMRKRMLEDIDSALRRNVENLRWATRQNLEDAFRRFGADLDERLALSLNATRGAMKAAFDRRTKHSEAVEAEIADAEAASSHLGEIAEALQGAARL